MSTSSDGSAPSAQIPGSTRNAGSRRPSRQVRRDRQTFAVSDMPPDDLEDFVPYAIELASTLKDTILVDQIPYHHQRREDLIQLLDEHITENIVKVKQALVVRPVRASDLASALDWERILSSSCWDSTRIGLVIVAVLLRLRRSGTSQVQIQRRQRERRSHLPRMIPTNLSRSRCF